MERKTYHKSNKVFKNVVELFDNNIILIGDYDYKVDGVLITHISISDKFRASAIACSNQDDPMFWEYDFDQLKLTTTQWKDIIEIFNDMLL